MKSIIEKCDTEKLKRFCKVEYSGRAAIKTFGITKQDAYYLKRAYERDTGEQLKQAKDIVIYLLLKEKEAKERQNAK